MRYQLLALLLLLLLTPAIGAQLTFDDFKGTAIDTKKWMYGGDKCISVANSMLRFTVPSDAGGSVLSVDAFYGDFSLTLDCAKFQGTTTGNVGWLSFYVLGAGGAQFTSLETQLALGPKGRHFSCTGMRGNTNLGSAQLANTATACEIRVSRNQKALTVQVRPKGLTAWTTLKTYTDFLPQPVYIEIHGETEHGVTLNIDCDKVTYTGAIKASPVNYGTGCHSFQCRAWGLPNIGNQYFGMLVLGDKKLANAPLFFSLGFNKMAMNLAPLGAPACTLYTYPNLMFMYPNLSLEGEGFANIPLPNEATMIGFTFFSQFISISFQNPLGLVFSNGVETKLMKL